MAAATFEILGRRIGPGYPCYVIAEMSANHHGDYGQAVAILQAAKAAGADAVKLQTYTADTMTVDSAHERFRIPHVGSPWDGRRLYDLYGEGQMPWSWQPRLADEAAELGLHLFSTAYDASAVDFLQSMGTPAFKVASFELTDLPLLRRVAQTGKPVIASTGMATAAEIEEAVRTLRDAGCQQLALLKCVSAYPAPAERMNLRTIAHLAETYGLAAGLSDHSMELAVPVAAVALGATIIEKHLTLDRGQPGPDSAFSLEPREFGDMVQAVRTAEKALGGVCYGPAPEESLSRRGRRSLFVVRDVAANEVLTDEHVRAIRPDDGLHPRYLDDVLGRRAARAIQRGTPLSWDLIGGIVA
ncbi:MAG: pseudaminic acid synthase [Pirellulales bacterium]